MYPLADNASIFAPYFISNLIPFSWPMRAARCIGVKDRGPECISVLAPLRRRALRTFN